MDGKQSIAGEFQDDHLEKVPVAIRADEENLRRIGIWFDIDDDDRAVTRVKDIRVGDPVARAD